MNPILHTQNLSVGYKSTLNFNINLSLFPAQLTCLMGRNGAGKSTIIKTLSRLLEPLSGSVFLKDEPLSSLSEKEISKKIGVVLTHTESVPYMTIFDLVAFGRYPYTDSYAKLSENDKTIIHNALETVGIENLKNRFVEELSDGERQKAALARVLAQQTDLILLDEPVAFLDFPAKIEMMYILKNLAHNEQKSILISTHDIEMALSVADNLLIIDNQRNIIEGTPEKLVNNGTIAHVFDTQKVKFNPENRQFCFQDKR